MNKYQRRIPLGMADGNGGVFKTAATADEAGKLLEAAGYVFLEMWTTTSGNNDCQYGR